MTAIPNRPLETAIREARLAGVRDAQNLKHPLGFSGGFTEGTNVAKRAEQAYYSAYIGRIVALQTMALNALHTAKTRAVRAVRLERVNALTKLRNDYTRLETMLQLLDVAAINEQLEADRA